MDIKGLHFSRLFSMCISAHWEHSRRARLTGQRPLQRRKESVYLVEDRAAIGWPSPPNGGIDQGEGRGPPYAPGPCASSSDSGILPLPHSDAFYKFIEEREERNEALVKRFSMF